MYIGIDLGGTNIAAGLVSLEGKIIHKLSVPTGATRHYTEILKDMAHVAIEVVAQAGYTMEDVISIGIGSPGNCDSQNGILVYTNNINFSNVPMRAEIQKYINKPVFLSNDANCAALGEYFAIGKPMSSFIAITLGTGVGGGIILDGKVYAGANGAGGELGHTVIVHGGEPCTCGRYGCWETYASATALVRQTRIEMARNPFSLMCELTENNLERAGGKTAFTAARAGDPSGQKVVDQYIEYVALGIVNIINIFQPDMLVIGGGVCKEGDYLLHPIREFAAKETYKHNMSPTQIAIATLGNDAGIIGAALLGK